ncbi:MAG TPA: ankyrin repeat domain-containing protein [Pirellulales bacterium]|nr:ankyrin repeat domain-containing protein [Pirellulales bacterium]HVA48160.1 ankyrin repeat domain-containing protein [Pirellulales bacterium]
MAARKKATAGKNKAAAALARAVDRCDPDGIRQAVAEGASLTYVPETSMSPLMAALSKVEDAEWKECAELLIELGCPVDGVNNDPPIVHCVDEDFDEPDALEMVELLLAHGADVNAADSYGNTALFRCVVDNRVELVRFLLAHGADPNIKHERLGMSSVAWVCKRYEDKDKTELRQRAQYADLLGLLTGEAVEKPKAATLSPALAAENERFRRCVTARRLLPLLDANLSIRRKKSAPFEKRRWYRDWRQQLLDTGFEFAQHFDLGLSDKSAFTNSHLGFDALLSGDAKGRCEIIAYHRDYTTTTVASFADAVGGEFAPPSRDMKEFKGASPAELVDHLKELVRGKEMMRVDASSFASRYTEALNRVAHETGERALEVLKTPTIFIDGMPARFERLGCYFDFVGAGWKDPGFSSQNWVRDWRDEFAKANTDPPDSTDYALDAAMKLVAMSHFQFASAPEASEFLAAASDAALAHFQAIAEAGKDCVEAAPWFQFRALLRGLLLCALAGRWETFKQVCNLVQPKLASAKTAGEEDLEFAAVLLLLVSSYRDRALKNAATLEQEVAKRLAKPPRLLLDLWRAIAAGQSAEVERSLQSSLAHFMELRGDKIVPAQRLPHKKWNDLFSFIALPESLFYLAARHRGLHLSPLPTRFADMLVTPETTRVT